MSAQGLFTGGGPHPSSEEARDQRVRTLAFAGAGVTLALLLVFTMAQGGLLDPPANATSLAAGTSGSAHTTSAQPPTGASLPPPISAPAFSLPWPTYMGSSSRTGYAAQETALTPATVANLTLRWKLRGAGAVFAQPVVANGLIYWGSWDGYEHATSAETGKDVWVRYLGQTIDTTGACDPSGAGITSTATVAFAPVQGRRTPVVFVGGGDAVFYALNAQTGAVVWQTRLGPSPSTYLWSSPAYYDNSIYMGTSSFGDCPLIQGQIVKLNAANGKVEAVFNVVPAGCTGGSVWGSVTIDPATGLLYAATGNQGECDDFESYAPAVLALRTSDLALAGSWVVPPEQQIGDGDFGYTPTLFTTSSGGGTRTLVGVGNKSGIFYALDAANISAGSVWSVRIADVGYCAQCGDGSYVPGAWDGKALYVPSGKTTINGEACAAGLRALNPATGQMIWGACLPAPTYGALTALPGLLVLGASPYVMAISTQGPSAGRALFTFRDPQVGAPWFFSSAGVADGAIYIGDSGGNFYALGV